MIPLPNEVPIGGEWVMTCPRIAGTVPGGQQPVQEVLLLFGNGQSVVEWSYALITPQNINQGTATNQQVRDYVQNIVGYPTDDAGHVVGKQLGGSGTDTWNIFPQSRNFNRGAYAKGMEAILRNVGDRNLTAEVWYNFYEFTDPNKILRANKFRFLARISDGTIISDDLENPQ